MAYFFPLGAAFLGGGLGGFAFRGWRCRRSRALARIVIGGEHDLGDVERAFALDDAALGLLLRFAGGFLDEIDALDDDAAAVAQDLEDLAALALLGAGEDDDFVVLLDVELGLRIARLVDAVKSHG